MFVPEHFEITDPAEIAETITANSFAILASNGPAGRGPIATHLPILLRCDASGAPRKLAGHMARANPHWRAFDGEAEAVAMFNGPHAYISPRWYPATEKVPTWNYVAVHVYGKPTIIDDASVVRALLEETVATYEAGAETPWSLGDVSAAFLDRMQNGIVAFEIPIDRIEAKAKLNQNHPPGNRRGAIEGLRASGAPTARAIADLMDAAARRD